MARLKRRSMARPAALGSRIAIAVAMPLCPTPSAREAVVGLRAVIGKMGKSGI